ncbi:hypothetical protein M3Y99_00653400 [Aphelenchoides fujianensis]|nr:hypothetical protein M3Y99_00653400 [Aphelenchoides fujianensis]
MARYWSFPYFNSSHSQTLTNTREEWRAERSLLFETRGQIVEDFLGLTNKNQTDVLMLESGVFVEGWQWDVFNAIFPAGFLGLAPGPKNFVVQAFAQRKIAAPIISFSAQARYPMTFGALSSDCTAWNHNREDSWLDVKCDQPLNLTFWVDGLKAVVNLVDFRFQTNLCVAAIQPMSVYPARRYVDIPQFLLEPLRPQ